MIGRRNENILIIWDFVAHDIGSFSACGIHSTIADVVAKLFMKAFWDFRNAFFSGSVLGLQIYCLWSFNSKLVWVEVFLVWKI